jgi:1-acyl-sn-glycerol-3-phosphate acyltransferase
MTAGGRRLDGKIIESAVIVLTRWLAGGCGRWAGCAPSEATRIYIANHTSHADLPLILGAMPAHLREHTSVVAAADYWCAGIVRRYVAEHAFRTILIRRDHTGRRQFEQMTDALDHGESLILFPEGTRGSGEHLQPLKCGIYHLAHERPEVEIVPVWIENVCRVLPKGAFIPAPMECSVSFGEPTHLYSGEDKESFLARISEMVVNIGRQKWQ